MERPQSVITRFKIKNGDLFAIERAKYEKSETHSASHLFYLRERQLYLPLYVCFIDDLVKCSVYVSNVTAMSNCIFLSLLLSMLRGLSNHPVPRSDSFQTKALNKTFPRMHSNPLVSWLRVCLFSNAENSFTRGENNYHPPRRLVALLLSSRGGRPL